MLIIAAFILLSIAAALALLILSTGPGRLLALVILGVIFPPLGLLMLVLFALGVITTGQAAQIEAIDDLHRTIAEQERDRLSEGDHEYSGYELSADNDLEDHYYD